MLGWVLTGNEPARVADRRRATKRRGPVANRPEISVVDRTSIFDNLRIIAELTRNKSHDQLTHRQACFLAGLNPVSASWIEEEAVQKSLPITSGWTPQWPGFRSVAASRARHGDAALLRVSVNRAYRDQQCEIAELNYWAYWAGEFPIQHSDDTFMIDSTLSWHGESLLHHLMGRLTPGHYLAELNLNTIATLLAAKPYLIQADRPAIHALLTATATLLDHGGLLPLTLRRANELRRHLVESSL